MLMGVAMVKMEAGFSKRLKLRRHFGRKLTLGARTKKNCCTGIAQIGSERSRWIDEIGHRRPIQHRLAFHEHQMQSHAK